MEFIIFTLTKPSQTMFSLRSLLSATIVVSSSVILAQPGSTSSDPYHVHHKHVSAQQGVEHHFGSTVAIHGDVLVASDETQVVEVLRRNMDGSWTLEATLAAPAADIDFGGSHALATNGDWIAVGARFDDTFGTNAGAVYMYKFDGLDWQYEGVLSHMAPHGSINSDRFGKGLAMDGDRMVVGSSAQNSDGGTGAIHYFQYHPLLDMWLESGFIASEGAINGNAQGFAETLDISGDWMIVGEWGNDDAGANAGAVHLYKWYNQCWHLDGTFLGHAADDRLGSDVAISGDRAAAGSPRADLNSLNNSGAVTLFELLPGSGGADSWTETYHFIPDAVLAGDRFGTSVDLDGDLLAVGAPRDDNEANNAGLGYFLFDCSTPSLECVAEGSACDAEPNDRFGFDVAVSNGLAAIGAERDDNIFEAAGSVYVLGADDLGFECDLTAPGAPEVDLIEANDTGVSAEDDTTRHTTPDFDVFLPGGGSLSVTSDFMAQAGDALVFYMEGSGDSTLVILTEDDIENGFYTFEFVYPGPVLEDGVYTFCAYLIDIFGNVGETNCQTILIDNDDPEPNTNFSGGLLAGSDTTLYLDDDGNATLDLLGGNITATDNIGIDTMYFDITDFDCDDAGLVTTVTLTVVDIAGNIATTSFNVAVIEVTAPVILTQDMTVYLDASGAASISPADIDNGSYDACSGLDSLSLDISDFDCDDLGGAVTVTLTGVDLATNSASATASVTVLDTIAPAIADMPGDMTLSNDAGLCSAVATWSEPAASDNCPVASFTSTHDSGDAFAVGTTTVTYTATDQSGNATSASFTVTVTDDEAPTISGTPADITQSNDAGNCSAAVSWTEPTVSDNCAVSTSTSTHSSGDTFAVGTTTVTYTATDIHGNTTTSTFDVTVTDDEAPSISGTPADITQTNDAGNCSAVVTWTCLLYTSPSPRDRTRSRMPSSA